MEQPQGLGALAQLPQQPKNLQVEIRQQQCPSVSMRKHSWKVTLVFPTSHQ